MYSTFIFVSLEDFRGKEKDAYFERLNQLKSYFLELNDADILTTSSVVLSKIRLLKDRGLTADAFKLLESWMKANGQSDVLKIEYIKLLILVDRKEEALKETQTLLNSLHSSLTRHYCSQCGFNSDEIFWRCPQCYNWETIQFRWKV
jgi:lipopolysaccharide biosynthesis regulator YciM